MSKLFFYVFLIFSWVNISNAETLVTPSYIVEITNNCAEGNVSCDNISYKGIRRSDDSVLELVGKTLNKRNSYDLYGYQFNNGDYVYTILINEPEFTIQKAGKIIASEKGSWQDNILSSNYKQQCEQLTFKDEDGNNDIYRSGNKCFYTGKTLLESYQNYKRKNKNNETGKYLRDTININKKYQDVIDEGYLEIIYNWISSKELEVKLIFAGGLTTVSFKEKETGTEVSTIFDAD